MSTRRCTLAIVMLVPLIGFAQGKAPLPDDGAIKETEKLVNELFQADIEAAQTSDQKTDLSKKLLTQAFESRGDPTAYLVLLRFARGFAAEGGDVKTALEATEGIGTAFETDSLPIWVETLSALSRSARSTDDRKAVAEKCLSVVDDAIAQDNFE